MNRTAEAQEHQRPQTSGRNGTQQSLSQKQRTSTEAKSVLRAPSIGAPSSDAASTKDRNRKGVSFLSRILGPNKSRSKSDSAFEQSDGVTNGDQDEGSDARLFSHSTDNVGYNPRHPHPLGYIKVRTKHKKEPVLDRLFLAQDLRLGKSKGSISRGELDTKAKSDGSTVPIIPLPGDNARRGSSESSNDAIWALEFSHDGKFLAAAGQDKIVRIWSVICTPEERHAQEREDESLSNPSESNNLSAPVFRREPLRQYTGHTSTILDLSWSKNNFLLSSSFDKTVRLWHVSRSECLVTFKHAEYCPSISFHPRDDRFFLAGSLDTKLRLWSIPDKSVAFWNQLPDVITAVAFTPDGKTAIAGTMSGSCLFYETEGLKFKTQINIKPSGRNAKSPKITGISATDWDEDTSGSSTPNLGSGAHPFSPSNSMKRDVKILISSNDSRIRLYNFRDKSLEMKFKSHRNVASQIRASFSDDSRYVISGSEDRKTYLWSTGPIQEGEKQRALETFEAHNAMTTGAILAPLKTRIALSASEDPVFDLCNPPPVTLVSRSESAPVEPNVSDTVLAPDISEIDGNTAANPTEDDGVQQPDATHEGVGKRAEESPAYLARCAHRGGHIIVSADYFGNIKVFRQDCAYGKRKSDLWSDAASVFSRQSRRVAGSIGGGSRIGRSLTGASRGSRPGSMNSSRSRAGSVATQPPGERILSWRQDLPGVGSAQGGSGDSNSLSLRAKAPRTNRERSVSPRKSIGTTSTSVGTATRDEASKDALRSAISSTNAVTQSSPNLSLTAPTPTTPQANATSFSSGDSHNPVTSSPVASIGANLQMVASPEQLPTAEQESRMAQGQPADTSQDEHAAAGNPLWLRGGRSYIFWNANTHTGKSGSSADRSVRHGARDARTNVVGHLSPPQPSTPGMELTQQASVVSRLSSECSTSGSDVSESGEGAAGGSGVLKCVKCGSTSFRAKTVHGQSHRLVCQRCGAPT